MAIKKLILHIGFPKTGSTSIQSWLRANEALLSDHGVLYPDTGKFFHHNFARSFLRASLDHSSESSVVLKPNNTGNFEYNSLSTDRLNNLCDEWRLSNDFHTILISSEVFTWHWRHIDFELLKKQLSGFEVSVLAYARPQHNFIEATYRERVQSFESRNSQSFSAFLNEYRHESADYTLILSRWLRVVDPESISVKWYERDHFERRDVRCDFHAFAQLPLNFDDFQLPSIDRNPSLHVLTLELMRVANAFRLTKQRSVFSWVRQKLEAYDEHVKNKYGKQSYMSAELRLEIIETFKETNSHLAKGFSKKDSGLHLIGSGRDNTKNLMKNFPAREQKLLRRKAFMELLRFLLGIK